MKNLDILTSGREETDAMPVYHFKCGCSTSTPVNRWNAEKKTQGYLCQYHGQPVAKIEKTCAHCGKRFAFKMSRGNGRRAYCSENCRYAAGLIRNRRNAKLSRARTKNKPAEPQPRRKCNVCGAPVPRRPIRGVYLTRLCEFCWLHNGRTYFEEPANICLPGR